MIRLVSAIDLPQESEPDFASARSLAAQRDAFRRHGLVVVPTRGKASGLARWVQIAVQLWAEGRLG